jgi:predicted O-methyltransferase YrrM
MEAPELLAKLNQLKKEHPNYFFISGGMDEEISTLNDMIHNLKPKHIMECGAGNTSIAIPLILQDMDYESTFTSVDKNEKLINALGAAMAETSIGKDKIKMEYIVGDSARALAFNTESRSMDMIFIDTSHELTQTVAEILFAMPKVSTGGCIILHDTKMIEILISIYSVMCNSNTWFFYECNVGAGLGVMKRK